MDLPSTRKKCDVTAWRTETVLFTRYTAYPDTCISMPSHIHSILPGILLAALSLCAYAESEPPHPVIDIPRTAMPSAEALEDNTISELRAQRESYAAQLDASSATSTEELEEQLLQALLVYDNERIQIIDMIPKMIEQYEVEGTLREDLMNFRATLTKIVEELRPEVTSLQRYKPYDFRLGVSYAAMMTIMQKKQDVRDRMLQDHKDPETMLGQHSQRLQQTYRAVQEARERLELGYQTETLKEQIDRIDTELRRRQS